MPFWKHENTKALEDEIKEVLHEMSSLGVTDPDYPKQMAYLERLEKVRAAGHSRPKLNLNHVLFVAGNLVGVLLLVGRDETHLVSTKALGQIIRPKSE